MLQSAKPLPAFPYLRSRIASSPAPPAPASSPSPGFEMFSPKVRQTSTFCFSPHLFSVLLCSSLCAGLIEHSDNLLVKVNQTLMPVAELLMCSDAENY